MKQKIYIVLGILVFIIFATLLVDAAIYENKKLSSCTTSVLMGFYDFPALRYYELNKCFRRFFPQMKE